MKPLILVPFDGSKSAQHALEYATSMSKKGAAAPLHLLNVQDLVDDLKLGVLLSREEIRAIAIKEGERTLLPAKVYLQDAGVPYVAHILHEQVAQGIARYCEEMKCDRIVMGTRGMGALASMVLGSTAQKVIHLVHVPVTLVK